MDLKTYNFNEVYLVINGVLVEGFGEGDVIDIEVPEDWTTQVGAGGAVTRSFNTDRTMVVTVKLQQTSLANGAFTALAANDRALGTGLFGFLLKDNLGLDLLAASKLYIEKPPNQTFGRQASDREWKFKLVNPVGGVLGTPNT